MSNDDISQVERAFNTRYFKREQPSNMELLQTSLHGKIDRNLPIGFAMYWGKGPRHKIGSPEQEAIAFIEKMRERIQDVYKPGAQLQLVFTDTHAALNGYSPDEIVEYFGSLHDELPTGWYARRMSELVGVPDLENLKSNADTVEIPAELAPLLLRASERNSRNVTGVTKQTLAAMYYLLNQQEKSVIEHTLADQIFLTYNSSKWNAVLPSRLPLFHMFSLRKGTSVKPWFAEDFSSGNKEN